MLTKCIVGLAETPKMRCASYYKSRIGGVDTVHSAQMKLNIAQKNSCGHWSSTPNQWKAVMI